MKKIIFLLGIISCFIFTSCSKNDDPTYSEITEGNDEIISDNLFRVNNLLYQANEDKTCTLVCFKRIYSNKSSYKTYYSSFPYPIFDIPSEVTIDGNLYRVTAVDLNGYEPENKDTHIKDIKFITIPSGVISYAGSSNTNLTSLIIGSDVKSVSNVVADKIFWLPNTPPSGYKNVSANVQFAASFNYNKEILVYPNLNSMFSVDGISYVITDADQHKCDLIGVTLPKSDYIECNGTVENAGISYSVQNIVKYSFYGSSNLVKINAPNVENIGDYAFFECEELNKLNFDNVKSIGESCFNGCKAVNSIIIGEDLVEIGKKAFRGCSALKSFKCNAINPPICGSEAFEGINMSECVLSVPFESIEAYQAADQWKDFKKYE
ncbi:MAG: leucine-rich repeat domain-containing protein [Muribaculaceae bacterium]|nr:leucine-rich repeat domain-containing protein [Muribaculaceae bacterium]